VTRLPSWVGWAAAIVGVAGAAAFFTGMVVAARYEARVGHLARELSAARQELETARRDVPDADGVLVGFLADPATRIIPLRGRAGAPGASGRVLWHPRRGGHLWLSGLPAPPDDQAYVVWAIIEGQAARMAAVEFDAAAAGEVALPARAERVDGFIATLERAPTVPRPFGPVVLGSD
jgi:hypothetical protein